MPARVLMLLALLALTSHLAPRIAAWPAGMLDRAAAVIAATAGRIR